MFLTSLQLTGSETAATDTSDWETYTNETYGWSVQYPSDWEPILDDDENSDVELKFRTPNNTLQEIGTSQKTDTLEEWYDKQLNLLDTAESTRIDTTIAEVPAIRQDTNILDQFTYVAFRTDDLFINVITSNAAMFENGMLGPGCHLPDRGGARWRVVLL
jgi:hypothetical protein